MKPNCASRRILIPFLLLFATGELSTVAQQPVQKNAYFKTHFQNESQFIVETIVSDLAEQVYYAKHRRLPDAQQFSVVSVLKDYGNDFPDESTPRYEITISFETNRPGLRAALQVNGPIWSPKIYAGLATMLATNAGLNVGGPREQNDDLALLSALADSTAITIEIENQKLSKALEREFTNPFFHEEAAVLLGAFALRDHAGDFSDIRLPLCRMTAHLCMAQLVSGQRAPSMTGRMADAMLFTLMNNEVSGLEKLDQLDSRDPVIMKWVRTLRAYNTKDYRQITNSAATSPIENIARFNAFARFVDVSAGWNRLTENEKKIPDYVRIAETRDFSVETGHELLDVSLPLEVKECMAIYEKCHAQQLAPAGMIRELNVAPERCFTTATDGSIRVDVIGWGQWASFFQRHVCLAMVQDFDFMERKWGVHDEAARYAAAFDKTFGGLRLYPLVRRFNCTDAASYLNAVKDGEKVCSATPHLVSFRCWHHLIVPVAGAQAPSPGALEDWIVFGAPPGTAFEAGERQFLFHYKARGPKAHELAPYETNL
jgi:hypothetical protein